MTTNTTSDCSAIATTQKPEYPNDRIVFVTVKNVYGNELIYPACDDSQTFANLTGKKTLSLSDLRNIMALGYTVARSAQTSLGWVS